MDKRLDRENINCNFCGDKHYSVYDSVGDWNIVKCKNCGFHYTNPRPRLEDLHKYYEESYFTDERHSKKFYNEDGTVRVSIENYTNRIEAIESNVNSRGSILEIGAARGGFLKVMKDRGWDVHGVEISEDAVKLAKEANNIELFCGVFDNYNSNKKFDIICMYQTLEHVPNPKEIIRKAYELLNENGLLVIEVPNIKGYDIKKDIERRMLVYDLPRHLNHFSPNFLSKQLTVFGFKILGIDKYYPQFMLDFMNRKTLQEKQDNQNEQRAEVNIKKEELLKTQNKSWKLKLIDNVSNIYPGWRFTIVAKK